MTQREIYREFCRVARLVTAFTLPAQLEVHRTIWRERHSK
jgi:hypothetical protein